MRTIRTNHQAGAVDKGCNREIDQLTPGQCGACRLAQQVGLLLPDRLEAVGGGDRDIGYIERAEVCLLSDLLGHLATQVDHEADRFAYLVLRRKRWRIIAIGDTERLVLADAIEHAGRDDAAADYG